MVDYDPSIIGKEFETTDPVRVSAEKIKKYCEVMGYGDHAPKGSNDALVAPADFAVTFRNGRNFFEKIPRFGGRRGFDAGKDVEFVSPIRSGDEITLSSAVKEIYEKTGRSGNMVFVVIRSTLRNQRGEVVAHVDHRFMNRD